MTQHAKYYRLYLINRIKSVLKDGNGDRTTQSRFFRMDKTDLFIRRLKNANRISLILLFLFVVVFCSCAGGHSYSSMNGGKKANGCESNWRYNKPFKSNKSY